MVHRFSKIAAPLNALLSRPYKKQNKKNTRHKKTLDSSASVFVPFIDRWSADCQESSEELKKQLMSGRVLPYPVFSRTFCCGGGCIIPRIGNSSLPRSRRGTRSDLLCK